MRAVGRGGRWASRGASGAGGASGACDRRIRAVAAIRAGRSAWARRAYHRRLALDEPIRVHHSDGGASHALTCHAALHAAGLGRHRLEGSLTGVFVGISAFEFADMLKVIPAGSTVYAATGSAHAVTAGRLSYSLGLQGPCSAYDTACSAALVASHAALRALQMQECDTGVVSGVLLMLTPDTNISFAVAGMTSAGGRCHTFDARADGYVRSESCGAVALQSSRGEVSLSVEGSAVRQDGKSASLTAPNGLAQARLIRAALSSAGVQTLQLAEARAEGLKKISRGKYAAAFLQSAKKNSADSAVESNEEDDDGDGKTTAALAVGGAFPFRYSYVRGPGGPRAVPGALRTRAPACP